MVQVLREAVLTDREQLFGEVRALVDRGDREAYQALVGLITRAPDDAWAREVLTPYLEGALRLSSWERWAVELDDASTDAWRTPHAGALTRAAAGIAVRMLPMGSELGERVLSAPPEDVVRELRWSDTYLWRDDLERIVASPHSPRLEALGLAHNAMDAGSYDALAEGASRFSRLAFLDVDNSALDERSLRALLSAEWPELKGLDISRNPCGATALDVLAELGWSPRIEQLDARDMGVSGLAVEHFVGLGPDRLTRLDLSGASLGGVGVGALAAANLASLTDLGLDRARLHEDVASLASAPWWARLESLSVVKNGVLPEDALRLFGQGQRKLGVLMIANNPLGPAGVEAVAKALEGAPLRGLFMQHTDAGDEGARALASAEWPGLETLNLWACGLTGEGARALARADFGLRSLDLGHNALGGAARVLADAKWLDGLEILRLPRNEFGRSASHIVSSRRLERVRTLDLAQNMLRADACRELGANTSLSELRTLRLESNAIGDAGAAALARGGALKGLEELHVWGCGIGDEGVCAMAAEAPWGGLKILNLNRNMFGEAGARALADAPWIGALEQLHLYDARFESGVGAAGVEALASSPLLGSLRVLELGQSGMGSRGFDALVASHSLERLRDLDINRCDLARGALAALDGARWSRLWRLMLWGNASLGPEDAEALARCGVLDQLSVLNLNQCAIGARGVHAILDSPGLESLRAFHVNCARMGDEAMMTLLEHPRLARFSALNVSENFEGLDVAMKLASAEGMRTTRMLYASRNALGDSGVSALANGASMGSMRFLELQANGIGARGARALGSSPMIARVETLDLSHNPLGDEGICELAAGTSLSGISHLKLSGCGVGDEGARALARSGLLARLDSLSIEGNAITSEGMRALAEAPRIAPSVRLELEDVLYGVPWQY